MFAAPTLGPPMLSRPKLPIPMLPMPVLPGPRLRMQVLPGLLRTPLLHTRLEMPSKHAAFDVAGTAMAMTPAPSSEHLRMTVERMSAIAFSLARMEVYESWTKPRDAD